MRFRNMCYKNVMPYPVYLQNPYLNNQNNLVFYLISLAKPIDLSAFRMSPKTHLTIII